MKPDKLYKSTITIWSAEDPKEWEAAKLINDAANEESLCHCSGITTVVVTNPIHFPDIDLFDIPDPKPVFPKPWKIGFHPTNGPTVYAANEIAVPWEEIEKVLNQESQEKEEISHEFWEKKEKDYSESLRGDHYAYPRYPYWK